MAFFALGASSSTGSSALRFFETSSWELSIANVFKLNVATSFCQYTRDPKQAEAWAQGRLETDCACFAPLSCRLSCPLSRGPFGDHSQNAITSNEDQITPLFPDKTHPTPRNEFLGINRRFIHNHCLESALVLFWHRLPSPPSGIDVARVAFLCSTANRLRGAD